MPEVKITIGGRDYHVACQEGEEHFLHSAAAMLDNEATALTGQIGRLPEPRMLLMAGLMLADKTAGMEEQLQEMKSRAEAAEAELAAARDAPPAEPERIEVSVIPDSVSDSMADIADRLEGLADRVEARAAAG